MQMNKNQLTMAVIGGVGGVIALAVFTLAWMKSSDVKLLSTEVDGKRSQLESKVGLTNEIGKQSEKAAKDLAARASAAYEAVTNGSLIATVPGASQLQKDMTMVHERYKKLPDGSTHTFIKEEFGFGTYFNGYVKGGAIPKPEETPAVARHWGNVYALSELLLEAGAVELLDVVVDEKKPVEEKKTTSRRRSRNAAKSVTKYDCTDESYTIKFLAQPAALVRFLNLLEDSKRFFVIDSMGFRQEGDPLMQMIGADQKDDRAGRMKNKEELSDEPGLNKVYVTNPATTEPLTVTIKITATIFAEKKEAK